MAPPCSFRCLRLLPPATPPPSLGDPAPRSCHEVARANPAAHSQYDRWLKRTGSEIDHLFSYFVLFFLFSFFSFFCVCLCSWWCGRQRCRSTSLRGTWPAWWCFDPDCCCGSCCGRLKSDGFIADDERIAWGTRRWSGVGGVGGREPDVAGSPDRAQRILE